MTNRFRLPSILGLLSIGLCATPVVSAQPARYVDPADDERLLPFGGHVLTDRGNAQIVRFRNWDRFNPVREVRSGDYTLELPVKVLDWSDFSYQVDGERFSLDDYMAVSYTHSPSPRD